MAELTAKRLLYVASESGSYGTDPSPDGSGYVYLPTLAVGTFADKKDQLATQYFSGRVFKTRSIAGPDGWELSGVRIPLWGFPSTIADGSSPGADDVLDILLEHLLGTQRQVDGENCAAGSAVGTLGLDTDARNVGDLVCAYLSTDNSDVPQWSQIVTDAADGSYTVAPDWAVAPAEDSLCPGANLYSYLEGGGNSLAFTLVDDGIETYTLTGGRITSAQIVATYGQVVYLEFSARGDAISTDGKGSLPAITTTAPGATPLVATLSPVYWDGTAIETKSVTINFGLSAVQHACTSGTNGRSDDTYVGIKPSVVIEPFQTDALRDDKRTVDECPFLCVLGATSGTARSMAVGMRDAAIVTNTDVDDQGFARASVTIEPHDDETGTSTEAKFFQIARV